MPAFAVLGDQGRSADTLFFLFHHTSPAISAIFGDREADEKRNCIGNKKKGNPRDSNMLYEKHRITIVIIPFQDTHACIP